jgi:hypothetical protein
LWNLGFLFLQVLRNPHGKPLLIQAQEQHWQARREKVGIVSEPSGTWQWLSMTVGSRAVMFGQ